MTLADKLNLYFDGKIDAISLIRQLSGMFDPKKASELLTLICSITRHVQNDLDEETFRYVWKLPTTTELLLKKELNNFKGYEEKSVEEIKEELIQMTAQQKELVEKNKLGPSVDENGISIEADLTGVEHDISVLSTYLTYRMRREEKDEENDKA